MSSKDFTCTPDNPWKPEMKIEGRILHPAVKEGRQQDGWPAGDEVQMTCPHCKHSWWKELPQ